MTTQNYGVDTFVSAGRGSPNGWSPGSDAQNWTQAAGASALTFGTVGGRNRGTIGGDTVSNILYDGARQFTDVDLYGRVSVSNTAVRVALIGRSTATNTSYRADITGTTLSITINNAGTPTTLASRTVTFAASTYYWLHFRIQGFGEIGSNPNNLKVNFWADPNTGSGSGGPTGEPAGWMLQASNSTLFLPGNFGFNYKASVAGQSATLDSFTCTDCPLPDVVPAYNTPATPRPYGVTLYAPNNNTPPMPHQTIIDMIGTCALGTNPVSSTGLGTGTTLRYQMRWKNVELYQDGSGNPLYDWGIIDDAIQKANYWGFRLLWPVQAPPTWRQKLDVYGSTATLTAARNTGTAYTTLHVTALPAGAYIPHGYKISVDFGTGNVETLFVWNQTSGVNATYTAGTTIIGISTTQNTQTAWTPTFSHANGTLVTGDTGLQFANASDFAAFCGTVAARYNGTSGYGRLDAIQIENEDYDTTNRRGAQGDWNSGTDSPPTWDMSSTWDNGGAILAPVYVASYTAIKAQYPSIRVFACSVRKTPNTAYAHIQNWLTGFLSQVVAGGGSVDGLDFHYYRNGTTDWDGSLITDPTMPTYTDNTRTVINAPSVASETALLLSVAATYAQNPLILCGETGWSIYDDGNGPLTTTTAARNTGTAYTTLAVNAGWTNPGPIPAGTAITVAYNTVSTSEIVYAYGTTSQNATTIQITTDSTGAVQVAWTPTFNHAIGTQVYGSTTTNTETPSVQSVYLKKMYDAMRVGGGDFCFIYTMWYLPTVTETTNPQWSTSPDSIVQATVANPIGSAGYYQPAYSMTVTDSGLYASGWVTSVPYSVKIAGNAVTVQAGTLNIDLSIGKRGQASFLEYHANTSTHYQQFQQVQILDQNSNTIFGGYIQDPKERKPGFQAFLTTDITCMDYRWITDKRVIFDSGLYPDPTLYPATTLYPGSNSLAKVYTNRPYDVIVQDIFNKYLAPEGVTLGAIFTGPLPSTALLPRTTLYPNGPSQVISQVTFNYPTVTQALDALATSASSSGVTFYWSIDQNKQFLFVPYSYVINSRVVDGTQIDQMNNAPYVQSANPLYRNIVYVAGGTTKGAGRTEYFIGDSNKRTWTLQYPVAAQPSISLNNVSKSVGFQGASGRDYYFQVGSNDITQDTNGTVLTSGDTLAVHYVPQIPNTSIAQNASEIAAQKALDGTTGMVESVVKDTNATSNADGVIEAQSLLNVYGVRGKSITFTQLASGYLPGQQITVTYAPLGFSSTKMLVENVHISDSVDGFNIWYTITAIVGPFDTTWANFFGKILAPAGTSSASSINIGI